MKLKAMVLLVGTLLYSLAQPLSVFADDLYGQDDSLKITRDAGYDVEDIYHPKADIIVDAYSGQILYGDNIDVERNPGSMTKLMSAYVILQAIKAGKISYDTKITARAKDISIVNNQNVSNSPMIEGHSYKVIDLLRMMLIPSSSAATLLVADYLTDDDPDAWLDQMNDWSKKIGMTNTHWVNAAGAEAFVYNGDYTPKRYDNTANNVTTARDMAILGTKVVTEFPELLEVTKHASMTILQGTDEEQVIKNYNNSLEGGKFPLKGADGLKTGSSPQADYNYMATVERDGQRFVQLTMGVGTYDNELAEDIRHLIGNALAEKMYETYSYEKLASKGQLKIGDKTYQLDQDFYATVKKGSKPQLFVKKDRLYADNGLKDLSPSIATGLKVKEIGSDQGTPTRSGKKANFKLSFDMIFILIPVFILILVFKRDDKKRRSKR